MESNENPPATTEETTQSAPADALSRTPDELEQEQTANEAATASAGNTPAAPAEKKISSIKRFISKVNLYFLIFMLLVAVGGIITIVNYLNSKKETPAPSIAAQELTQDALREMANKDASVGNASHTLNIQGNAIIAGQTLMRGNTDVAGNLQTGGSIQGPSLTISGTSNLAETQANSLQVANDTAIQGNTTLRNLSVSGTSSFSGAMNAAQITVTRLIMSGDAVLQVPNHISFAGAAPSRAINAGVLGNGGSASVDGSDTSGAVNINTGNGPTPGCFVTITFNKPYPSQPRVLISPVGVAAGQTNYYVTRNNTGFSICTANAAPANQAFSFDYFVSF